MAKKTLVLLPGYDGDGDGTFAKLVRLLSADFECVVINYPYYRQIDRAYTLSELIDYLHNIIKDKHLTKLHLLGFSMGGFVAITYALSNPQNVLSLTLASSSTKPILNNSHSFLLSLAYYLFKIPLLAKLFSLVYTSNILRPLTEVSPLPLPRDNFPSSEGYPVFGSLANVMHGSITTNRDDAVRGLICPKQAILFEGDLSFPAATYASLLTNLGFRVIVEEHGGHATSSDYWKKVYEAIHRLFE